VKSDTGGNIFRRIERGLFSGPTSTIDAWARTLSEAEHLSPATDAYRLSALSSFYRYAEIISRKTVKGFGVQR
jgi:hypothetical protein